MHLRELSYLWYQFIGRLLKVKVRTLRHRSPPVAPATRCNKTRSTSVSGTYGYRRGQKNSGIMYLIKFFNITLHYTRVSSSLMVLTGVSCIRLRPKPRHWKCDQTKTSISESPSGSLFTTLLGSGSMRFGLYTSHLWSISYILFCPSILCLQSCFHASCLLFSRLR